MIRNQDPPGFHKNLFLFFQNMNSVSVLNPEVLIYFVGLLYSRTKHCRLSDLAPIEIIDVQTQLCN